MTDEENWVEGYILFSVFSEQVSRYFSTAAEQAVGVRFCSPGITSQKSVVVSAAVCSCKPTLTGDLLTAP